ncbi:MAG: hypothetical protein K9L61_00220 [Candidatus Omnitrophica bacterium]|nr:hypothetical protein [Candidatus Omnitrophota bacterium]
MKNLNLVQQEFQEWTLLSLPERETNKLKDKVQRKDSTFSLLSDKMFDCPCLLAVLRERINYWLKIDRSETTFAVAGYIFYLGNDFKRAENYFYKALGKNRENLDNWVDLAFSLYHQGSRKNNLAKAIFFNYDFFINEFKMGKYKNCNLIVLEAIYRKIRNKKNNYVYNWQKFVIE